MNLSFVAVRVKPDFIMFRWNASPLQTLKKIDSITTDLSLRLKIGSSNLVPRKSLCLFFRSFCLEYINAFLFLKLLCSCLQFKIMARYPLSNPNSGIHILHTVFIFHFFWCWWGEFVWQSDLNFLNWWRFPLFSWPLHLIQRRYFMEKLEAGHS